MNWPQQPPPPPPGYYGGYPPQPPPLPADARIKQAVRRGQVFQDPYDARRACDYAEGFLKNGSDLSRAPILVAIILGLLFTVLLQLAVGNWFVLVIPVGAFLGLIAYVSWFSLNKQRVEQSLHGNRQVIGR
jgi:hypothetical protein